MPKAEFRFYCLFLVYLGYQIPYYNNPQNLAVGLGYRFRWFLYNGSDNHGTRNN